MAEIVIRNLRKEFGSFTAVQSSSFTIADGEFFMLLGPSGCGKTTTLRMIAGLELPTSGQILIDGEDVSMKPASQRDIAMVFQMFALYPHMNVRKNISYPLVSQGVPKAQIAAKVAEVARILGIESILDKPVGGLAGAGIALGAWGAAQATAYGISIFMGGAIRDVVGHLATSGRLGVGLSDPSLGYSFVYHFEIGLLFATLAVLGPMVRLRPLADPNHPQTSGDGRLRIAEFPT